MTINPWAALQWALLLLTVPFPWLVAVVLAIMVHEWFHIVAIWALGGRIHGVHICLFEIILDSEIEGKGREAVAALAGPVGSILLFCLHQWIPRVALCALLQGVFNLLPIYPLDGGRGIRCVLEMLFPSKAKTIETVITLLLYTIMLIILLYGGLFGKAQLVLVQLLVLVLLKKKNTLQREENRGTIVLPFGKR